MSANVSLTMIRFEGRLPSCALPRRSRRDCAGLRIGFYAVSGRHSGPPPTHAKPANHLASTDYGSLLRFAVPVSSMPQDSLLP
jgi:hypothetical protein